MTAASRGCWCSVLLVALGLWWPRWPLIVSLVPILPWPCCLSPAYSFAMCSSCRCTCLADERPGIVGMYFFQLSSN